MSLKVSRGESGLCGSAGQALQEPEEHITALHGGKVSETRDDR